MYRSLILLFVALCSLPLAPCQALFPQTPIGEQNKVTLASARKNLNSPTPAATEKNSGNHWNIPLPTLGGVQFWTDHRWWYGWRIQYNNTLDHWRLIDPNGIRRAWGTKQAMLRELDKIIQNSPSPTPPDDIVILIHGLFGSTISMRDIASAFDKALNEESSNPSESRLLVASYSYASTRDAIAMHSAAFREYVENLPSSARISIVGHSMGNIVFRHAIGYWQALGDPNLVLPRLHRVVMLGPPNQGSSFAARLSQLGLFEVVTGTSGIQLGPAWDQFRQSLGTPPCPFAIFAGDISALPLPNLATDKESDGIVTLEEAALDGAELNKSFPALHSFLMKDPNVQKETVRFILDSIKR